MIEDCSDEGEVLPSREDEHRYHNVAIGFSIAESAEQHSMAIPPQQDMIPNPVSGASCSANREDQIISALDSCVQEMAALDPQEKLVHCATVLQVFLSFFSSVACCCCLFSVTCLL